MTSNQLFHGLNDRFRKRTQFLYRLGFRYECADFRKTTEYDRVGGIAAMIRRHYTGPADVVPIGVIHHTHNREWATVLGTVLRMA